MTPFATRLSRYFSFTSLAIAVIGVLFSLYVAADSGGYAPFLGSDPVMWGLTFFWLTNVITLVLNAVVWLCGRRPAWFSWTIAVQLLLAIGLLFVEG
ncbi:TPA: hypothetical protein QEM39_005223 [Pseudomonas putida]|jgi:hypothetical protein|uniref:hypothetical protein n=1 Tax=Pseudomonas TaxID=286 RepID=UPI00048647E7|nr:MULTISPECIES: hypothetical protein [Pseudomonas]MDD2152554.1 hypothetical protein [Pseudomonas putida]RAS21585.1 hypothetical protein H040_04789 [Pseudomonas sp. URMO17WK12:I7]SMF64824.1 hypothetical protein SAMN02745903_04808 [Pseudomonas sp. URMO17WK12:I5]HDS1683589.1 hypothetical protein [Pseudomonas putida]